MAGPLHNVRDISQIAYGFMASKVLFAALDLDLFGLLAAAAKTSDRLAGDTGVLRERLEILLTACVGLGLLVKRDDTYANAPASQSYLVRSAPSYFGTTIASRSIARFTRRSSGCRTRYAANGPSSTGSWTTLKRH